MTAQIFGISGMSGIDWAGLMLALMLVLLFLRIPVAVAMFVAGSLGYIALSGLTPLLQYLKSAPYWRFASYDLSVIPLFILMGHFAEKSGLSRGLFEAASALLGQRRGGLAMAAIGGCAGFGAICGSSLATAATMSQVALPELKRYSYAPELSAGVLAAGGTLGILIPPSVALVLYAILTEQNIATLFLAAFLPGLLAAGGYMLTIWVWVRLNADLAPKAKNIRAGEKWRKLIQTWPAALLFVVVIGGIYAGIFTPTEGGAVGAVVTAFLAFWKGGMRISGFVESLLATAVSVGMIFLLLLGADVLSAFLALSQLPVQAGLFIQGAGLSATGVLLVILLGYVVLGCFMESLSMILVTTPIVFPIVLALDFGPFYGFADAGEIALWFGVLTLIVVEMGLITPPVGLAIFIIHKQAKNLPLGTIYRGVLPFLLSDILRILLLIALPWITLVLPRLMMP